MKPCEKALKETRREAKIKDTNVVITIKTINNRAIEWRRLQEKNLNVDTKMR